MITYHPSAAKLPNGKGFKPMVMLRKDAAGLPSAKGRMVGSKSGATVYTLKDDARNAAREACHVAVAALARDYPQFQARVA